jgi:UPF0755 protein
MTDDRAARARTGRGLGLMRLIIIGLFLIIALALVAGAGVIGGYAWLGYQYTAEGPAEEDRIIQLQRGVSERAIAARLEAEGLIADADLFLLKRRIDTRLEGPQPVLRAGEFAIPARASMA